MMLRRDHHRNRKAVVSMQTNHLRCWVSNSNKPHAHHPNRTFHYSFSCRLVILKNLRYSYHSKVVYRLASFLDDNRPNKKNLLQSHHLALRELIEPIILAWNVPVARAKVPRIIDRIPVVKTAKRFDIILSVSYSTTYLASFPVNGLDIGTSKWAWILRTKNLLTSVDLIIIALDFGDIKCLFCTSKSLTLRV